ncbi:alanine:cation symporter family protein [Corynebacterium sp. CCM 8835]|uniref:Alanine:cation symporter family protein n=1 Tax=Corynebacterium antarcticum TaxID=2800405 RepID=A0ABS1FJL1_9CORY|nr:alanine/glycine:cation symporter family protein [Corynebacterium antarcticum]MCK7641724.1 alanine:cation symporter family protein [Corynebacterium antarcticum]MCL0244953.1 alanine:cation symporter family protein [Corynebacterium antarcticum]
MEQLQKFVGEFNDFYWQFVLVLLIGAGLYFCWTTLVVQIRFIPDMFRSIVERTPSEKGEKNISAFKAFTVSAASRVGTGNVAGVAIAIAMGGPGAVFWMWTLAVVGGATSFVESTLAQVYKVRDRDSFRGGPAYYITRALGWRWLAVIFAVLITLTYGFVFNAVQSNSIADSMTTSFEASNPVVVKIIVGAVLALVTAAVIFGGIQRIGAVTQVIVPVMAVAYIIVGIIVVVIHIGQVPGMVANIWAEAFGFRSVTGAAIGTVIMNGVRRGLFSNEAGMGSVPNAAATATVSHPAKQGLIQTLGVYFDTIVVCSVTAFIILLSKPDYDDTRGGMELTQKALADSVGTWGIHFLTVIIIFLAFSSVIGNYYYGETNIEFLTGSKTVLNGFRALVVLCVFGGALGSVPLVWALADTFSGLMATANLIAIIPLGGVAVALLRHFSEQRARGLNPVFHRDDLPRLRGWENMECWDGSDAVLQRDERYDEVSRRVR